MIIGSPLTPWRRLASVLAALTAGGLIAAVQVVPASAEVTTSAAASIVDSECSGAYDWSGDVTPGNGYPKGTVKVCFYKYQISDKDSKADYYTVVARSVWKYTGNEVDNSAPTSQSIKSNVDSIDNVYSATSTYTSSKSCTQPVTVSLGFGPFSVSATPQICSGYKVTRTVFSSKSAVWSSTRAGGLRTVETVFNQKVPQGKNPTYTVVFSIPQYYYVDAPAPYYVKAVPRSVERTFYGK